MLKMLLEMLDIIILNAELAPDPRMQGMTDCYLVSLDDIENAKSLNSQIKE